MTAHALAPRRGLHLLSATRRGAAWPVYALFLGLPLWWLLGAAHVIWPLVAAGLLASLLVRRDVRVPGGFMIWLLFLAWMLVSAAALPGVGGMLGFALRFSLYASAGILFLWLCNSPWIPSRAIVSALAGYWALVVVGGYLGVLFPTAEYRTPVESLLPGSLAANEYVRELTHARFAEIQTFLGYPVGRPTTFFTYTNGWGSAFALLAPFAVAAVVGARSLRWRRALLTVAVLSFVPAVISLNRGMWISLLVAGIYMLARLLVARNARAALRVLASVGAVALLIAVSPLGGLIDQRLANGNSNAARESLYRETFARAAASPLIGYGAPRQAQTSGYLDPAGTQGQVLYLVFSHGFPGLLLFFAWLGHAFVRSAHARSPDVLAAHVALLIAAVQAPFYGLLKQMFVIAAAAAVALRPEPLTVRVRGRTVTP